MLQALALALQTWQGRITPALLLSLAFLMDCINALDMPVRQSLVANLVEDRTQLANAIALNSMIMNATRFIDPALAGFIIAVAGEAVCFLLNAASYLAVILALLALRVRSNGDASKHPLRAMKESVEKADGCGERLIRETRNSRTSRQGGTGLSAAPTNANSAFKRGGSPAPLGTLHAGSNPACGR